MRGTFERAAGHAGSLFGGLATVWMRQNRAQPAPKLTPATMSATRRDEILALLSARRPEMAERFGAVRLWLFGSAARDEVRADSDVDALVDFGGPATFDAYFGLQDYLQSLIGRRIDLVTTRGLKPRARQHVQRDLIDVA